MTRKSMWASLAFITALLSACTPVSRHLGEGGGSMTSSATSTSSSAGGASTCVLGQSTVGNCVLGQ
jgi:hypothetical protein